MKTLFLIKPGELTLKGENRAFFERILLGNIAARLHGIPHQLSNRHGRLYLETDDLHAGAAEQTLRRTFGIAGFARALAAEKNMPAAAEAALSAVRAALAGGLGARFKVEARREDKSFQPDSHGIACRLGDLLRESFPALGVEVKKPDWVLNVEVRDRIYVYILSEQGERGLPVGSSGRGLLLLSGGIDSPVAGFLMARRGLRLDALHFHSYPYTSRQAREKVETLARILSDWTGRINLNVVPFTDIQLRIRSEAPAAEATLLARAAMMRVAHHLAWRRRIGCLVTGESLGQVASQTMEAIRFTGSLTDLPVFRPLIGMDKGSIVGLADRIGSYETSILPYEDCCVVFSPKHPLIKPGFNAMQASWEKLNLEEDLLKAADAAERVAVG
jgi:tRNA uracil 4-sulfurtransferase